MQQGIDRASLFSSDMVIGQSIHRVPIGDHAGDGSYMRLPLNIGQHWIATSNQRIGECQVLQWWRRFLLLLNQQYACRNDPPIGHVEEARNNLIWVLFDQ